MSHGRIAYNVQDLKLGASSQNTAMPDLQVPQDVLEQTEMIYQDDQQNTMQAYIKYKA